MAERELSPVRLVICREDLPENPRWRELGYPNPHCWDTIELMMEAAKEGEDSLLWQEARRIYWEAIWRAYSRYKRGRPFFDLYWCDVEKKMCKRLDNSDPRLRRIVEMEIVTAAMEFGIGKRGAGIFRLIFGRPFVKE